MLVRRRFSLLFFALMVSTVPSFAADGTVTVNGEVVSDTCTVNGGLSTFRVTLPTLSTSALISIGSTAGATRFSIALTNCVGVASTVNTYFEAGSTINGAGRLINQTAGGASVDGQIQNADGSIVNLAASYGAQNTMPTTISNHGATQNYLIAYFSNASPTTAGTFSSSVVYSLVYP
jgi:major type 1 subunit fimbrin (pilin)